MIGPLAHGLYLLAETKSITERSQQASSSDSCEKCPVYSAAATNTGLRNRMTETISAVEQIMGAANY